MRALVVAPQPFFAARGTPLSVYYRTLVTAEHGVDVDLLTYGQGEDVDIPGVRVIRVGRLGVSHVPVGPSFAKLMLDVLVLLKLTWLLLRNRYHFVHAHEEAVFMCVLLKPLFGFKLVYDMHSSLPQQLTNFEFTRSKLLIGIFERLETAALRSADVVITICEDLYIYADRFLAGGVGHVLIENSVFDPVRVVERNGDGRRADRPSEGGVDALTSGIDDSVRLVVYAGTLEPYQGIDILVQGFSRVVEHTDDAFLVVAGGTPSQVEHYRGIAEELGLAEHCRFTGSVPRRHAIALNRRASVLVSTRVTGGNTPLKIYEQLASGVPLVATDVHSHTQVLNNEVAFLVDPDPDSVAEGILAALDDAAARERKAHNARVLYDREYSRDRYAEKVGRMLEALR